MGIRYSAEEMAHLLAEREREGLSIAELARRTGITRKTLHSWERRLREDPAHDSKFVEAVVATEAVPLQASVSIQIGAATVDIPVGGIDRCTLETIVDVLAERC